MIEIVSIILNLVLGGGFIVTVFTLKQERLKASANAKKAEAEAENAELDNEEKAAQILMEQVVKPLKTELNGVRRELKGLKKAVESIKDCPHSDACPVRERMRNEQTAGTGEVGTAAEC